jgi:hypothetical protein
MLKKFAGREFDLIVVMRDGGQKVLNIADLLSVMMKDRVDYKLAKDVIGYAINGRLESRYN